MPETTVEDEFARFADEYLGTFRPVPVEAMRTWRRTRRRGALWLAGLGAALVAALSLNALQPAVAPDRPPFTDRPVRLEGAHGTMVVRFTDRTHGWVLFDDCHPGGGCARFLGRSDDAGLTWRPVELPDLPAEGHASLMLRGADSFLVGVSDPYLAWWATVDGGRTYRALNPQDAMSTGDTDERPKPPTSRGPWRLTHTGLETTVEYSPDAGRTWRAAGPNIGFGAFVRVSPDGRDAWAIAANPTRVWRLTPDGALAEPDLPIVANADTISPANGGGLVMLLPGPGVGVWRGGGFTPLPAPLADAYLAGPLDDGSIALAASDGTLVVGEAGGEWVRYTAA
ncbi:hypothetical protein ACPPVO_46145 [Dactylosporangium sp. McL0621]|uniref:hypothetical protein n=1 Tax=Dactylosporangium sp. McL0621 TaxID=3415678 RepID=UPI003CF2D1A0